VQLDKQAIVKALRATAAATPPGKDQVILLENHDIDRFMSLVDGDPARARAGAAIALMLKGEPLIYYGQELGMRGRPLQNAPVSDGIQIPMREAFRWKADLAAPGSATWYQGPQRWWTERFNRSNDGVSLEEEQARPDSLYHWYRKLLALRHARPELREGSQRILCDDASAVLCILREQGARRTLLLVNLGHTDARPALDPASIGDTPWGDLLDGGAGAAADTVLHPMQVRVLGTR
jgi:alpha-amylase